MAQLRQEYEQFQKKNTVIAAIGPEDPEKFRQWWRENEMPFTGIPDPTHAIAKLYGQQVKFIKLGRMPASMLIDRDGKIRYTHFGNSMSDIPANMDIIEMIDELNKENPK